MSSEITIDGKVYQAKLATFGAMVEGEDIEGDISAALKKREYEKAYSLSVKLCGLYLEGDVSSLSMDKVAPSDWLRLKDFFVLCLGRNAPKPDESNKTSADSSVSTDQGASPKDMI